MRIVDYPRLPPLSQKVSSVISESFTPHIYLLTTKTLSSRCIISEGCFGVTSFFFTFHWVTMSFLQKDQTVCATKLNNGFFLLLAGCGGFFNVSGSTFSSPNYPSDYNNGDDCAYVIEAPADKVVQLTFTDFNVESHSTCNYDAVKVRL